MDMKKLSIGILLALGVTFGSTKALAQKKVYPRTTFQAEQVVAYLESDADTLSHAEHVMLGDSIKPKKDYPKVILLGETDKGYLKAEFSMGSSLNTLYTEELPEKWEDRYGYAIIDGKKRIIEYLHPKPVLQHLTKTCNNLNLHLYAETGEEVFWLMDKGPVLPTAAPGHGPFEYGTIDEAINRNYPRGWDIENVKPMTPLYDKLLAIVSGHLADTKSYPIPQIPLKKEKISDSPDKELIEKFYNVDWKVYQKVNVIDLGKP